MFKYRKADLNDVHQLMELRKKQLIAEGIEANIDIDKELYDFFNRKLGDNSLRQWLVEDDGIIIACGAVIIYELPPSYTNQNGKKGYITNMYTEENYRGKGIATTLLKKLVEEAANSGVSKLWLGASEMGRPVYKKFGFEETDEWLEWNS